MKDIQKLCRSTEYKGSLHVIMDIMGSRFQNQGNSGIRHPGIQEIRVVKYRILGFGIGNTAQGIWSPSDNSDTDCNPVPRIRNP